MAKFTESYRIKSPMLQPKAVIEPPKVSKQVEEADKLFEASNEEAKEVVEEPKKETAAELIKKIEAIINVEDLTPYIDSELKTVKNAAEKKFNELSASN